MEVSKMTNVNMTKHVSKEPGNRYLGTLMNMEHKVENMFHDLWHNTFDEKAKVEPFAISVFEGMPRLDMVNRDKEIYVKAELPGFKKKEIEVSVEGNQLVIRANAHHENKMETGDYVKHETSSSEIYRSLPLPADVVGEKLKRNFRNGVLELRIPKQE
jgi:HSP20 family protein